ncbi:N-acetyl sugar amidotransferase [Candidatus Falkowbacteria bacterium CG10_big_fil_rev_8_21_14_0_10_43_10]|uniref:N-acetyl sugar amidotransferase n=1 Tax=Candidatus Falkowbacteria bacterium CG10_big_fil_rev_8_21_14_0_10_43_10 TaxID=1974567 RepID=A0A2H0V244_9BACT|nr:MAG: N-acetyl sugar amidotransferase [Candidatus Falkowbacteria bacterium CG10_big_fil_rev_8_21_14_0_10_43_10]
MEKPKTLDKQLANQPTEVRFCKKCVVSNQRPRTAFNEAGVCSACQYAEHKNTIINWDERERQLRELLNKHRSKDGSFDVIVPASGGKDSALVAHQLKHKYGMHPLTVTWVPFLYTDIGWQNYQNFVKAGFDNILANPDGQLHRKLARVAFELKGDHWEPFTFGQKAYPFQMAVKFNIPLIFYGENGEVEYGGSMKNADQPFESPADWEELYFKGAGVDKLVSEGLQMGIFLPAEIMLKSFALYKAPPMAEVEKLGLQMHWWSYYHKWVPQENFYYAAKHVGFIGNPDGRSESTYSKYASLDDKTDGFHWYLGYIKFGLGRASRDAQMEIRSGHITREEAVALVRRYDHEFPQKYFKEFLEYLDISEEHFWQVGDSYRPPHLWEKVGGEWKLKHIVS